MNILTFDIEEWYDEKAHFGAREAKYQEFDGYLKQILDLLDERNIKGTFFCVGKMATDFPNVVKLIAEKGHEIGCHSNVHMWLTKLTQNEVLRDTREAIDNLEQCVGTKVKSYRAPAFSIGEDNKWAFEVLGQCGIKRDASVFPAKRDFGGFSQFGYKSPVLLYSDSTILKEFPICTTTIMNKEVAYSGGGYFRFFPLSFVKKKMAKSDYAMTYFHIGDFVPETKTVMSKNDFEEYFKEPGTIKNRYLRFIKSNLGKKGALSKLESLIRSTDFINLEQADNQIDWQKAHSVVL